jgi:hypothetical protein
MNSPLTRQIAIIGILSILSLIVVFHLLVMLGIVPFEIVWGGRLKDASQMLLFETVSVLMNLLMLMVVGIHAGIIKIKLNRLVIKTALWAMFLLFLLNTAGNLFSNNELEKMLFTPLTLLLSLFSLRLATSKEEKASI